MGSRKYLPPEPEYPACKRLSIPAQANKICRKSRPGRETVVGRFDCHPEQASFAQRGIWAGRFAPPGPRKTLLLRLLGERVRERHASKFKLTHYRRNSILAFRIEEVHTPLTLCRSDSPAPSVARRSADNGAWAFSQDLAPGSEGARMAAVLEEDPHLTRCEVRGNSPVGGIKGRRAAQEVSLCHV